MPLGKEAMIALMVKDTPQADPMSQGGNKYSDQQLAERFSRASAEDCDYMAGYLRKKTGVQLGQIAGAGAMLLLHLATIRERNRWWTELQSKQKELARHMKIVSS